MINSSCYSRVSLPYGGHWPVMVQCGISRFCLVTLSYESLISLAPLISWVPFEVFLLWSIPSLFSCSVRVLVFYSSQEVCLSFEIFYCDFRGFTDVSFTTIQGVVTLYCLQTFRTFPYYDLRPSHPLHWPVQHLPSLQVFLVLKSISRVLLIQKLTWNFLLRRIMYLVNHWVIDHILDKT